MMLVLTLLRLLVVDIAVASSNSFHIDEDTRRDVEKAGLQLLGLPEMSNALRQMESLAWWEGDEEEETGSDLGSEQFLTNELERTDEFIFDNGPDTEAATETEKTTVSDTGFNLLYSSTTEVLLDFEMDFTNPLPSWLEGNYLHNGPAQFEIGDRNLCHVFDGYGKLNKFSFKADGSATFSNRFIQTGFYQDSVKMDDVAPYVLFDAPQPAFGFWEKLEALKNGIDNTNINVYEIRDEMVVMSDFWHIYQVDGQTLETVRRLDPEIPGAPFWDSYLPIPVPSTSHPVQEAGRSSFISFATILNPLPLGQSSVNVVRLHSAEDRELLAVIERDSDKVPYMHSFALSPNYAVIFVNPYFVTMLKTLETASGLGGMDWYPDVPTDVYVVRLKDGEITKMTTDAMLHVHHVNSYELDDDTIVTDFTTLADPGLLEEYKLDILHDPTRRDSINISSNLRRFTIDLSKSAITWQEFADTPGLEFANHFEMPIINERVRHDRHCFIYGMATKTDGRHLANNALVKKDVCLPGNDKAWSKPNHYVSEPFFVARPGGESEDDGVLLCAILDGEIGQSYLGVFNPQTMELDSVGYLPQVIPALLHGRFFNI